MKRLLILLLILLSLDGFGQVKRSGRRVMGSGVGRVASTSVQLPFTDNFAAATLGSQWQSDNIKTGPGDGFWCIGDSKTAGRSWVKYLSDSLNGYFPIMPSLCHSGWKIEDAQASLSTYMDYLAGTPGIVLINLGINNGSPVRSEFTGYGYLIVDSIHARFPSAVIYFQNVWSSNVSAATLDSLNTFINLIVSNRPGVALHGPDERVWLKGSDNGATYSSDGTHYTEAGLKKCASEWYKIIAPYLSTRSGNMWAVSGGSAYCSPQGPNLVSNSGMENGSPPAFWAAQTGAGLSRIADPYSGVYALRCTTGTIYPAYQEIALGSDTSLCVSSGYGKRVSGSHSFQLLFTGAPALPTLFYTSSTYKLVARSGFTSTDAIFRIAGDEVMTVGDKFTWDDVTFKPLLVSTAAGYLNTASSDVDISVKVSNPDSQRVMAGVLVSYLDRSNFVAGVIDFDPPYTTQYLLKVVNGRPTKVIEDYNAYVAGRAVRVTKSGTTYSMYYGATLLGSATVSDAALVNNKKHGMFSTHPCITLDDFSLSAN